MLDDVEGARAGGHGGERREERRRPRWMQLPTTGPRQSSRRRPRRLSRDQLDRRPGATRSGCADQAGCDRGSIAERSGGGAERLETAEANLHAAQQSANNRYSPAEIARAQAALADAEAAWPRRGRLKRRPDPTRRWREPSIALDAAPTEFAEPGKLLLADGRPAP